MATASLERRLETLEQAGGGECPRCSGTTVVIVNDKLSSFTKGRRLFTHGAVPPRPLPYRRRLTDGGW
jgi:Ribonuclease G/E